MHPWLPVRQPGFEPLKVISAPTNVECVPLSRMNQVHELGRQLGALVSEVPEVPGHQRIAATDVLRGKLFTMQRIADPRQSAITSSAVEVVRRPLPSRPLRSEPWIGPVVAERHHLIHTHGENHLVVGTATQADDPVANARRTADLRLAHGQGTPAVIGIWRSASVDPDNVPVDSGVAIVAKHAHCLSTNSASAFNWASVNCAKGGMGTVPHFPELPALILAFSFSTPPGSALYFAATSR